MVKVLLMFCFIEGVLILFISFRTQSLWTVWGISKAAVYIMVKKMTCVDSVEVDSVLLDQCLVSEPTCPHLRSSGPRCRWSSRCKPRSSSWSTSSQADTRTGSEVAAVRSSTCRCRWATGSWQHRTGRCQSLYRRRQSSCCWKRTLIRYVLDTPKRTRQWSSAREEKGQETV